MYHYDDTTLIRASDAEMRHFLCSVTPVDVNEIFAQAGKFQIRSRIALTHVDERTFSSKECCRRSRKTCSKE